MAGRTAAQAYKRYADGRTGLWGAVPVPAGGQTGGAYEEKGVFCRKGGYTSGVGHGGNQGNRIFKDIKSGQPKKTMRSDTST